MVVITLLMIFTVYFFTVNWFSKIYAIESRTVKATKYLTKIIAFAPLLGILIFTVLFLTILKGKFVERSTHALLVFAIWMYAAQFYNNILAHYKEKYVLIASAAGVMFSITLAIILTPLYRYISLIFSQIHGYSIFFSIGLFFIFYVALFISGKNTEKKL